MKSDLDANEPDPVVAAVAFGAIGFAAVAYEAGCVIVDVSMICLTGPGTVAAGIDDAVVVGDGVDDDVDDDDVVVVVETAAVVAFSAAVVVEHPGDQNSHYLTLDHLVWYSHLAQDLIALIVVADVNVEVVLLFQLYDGAGLNVVAVLMAVVDADEAFEKMEEEGEVLSLLEAAGV